MKLRLIVAVEDSVPHRRMYALALCRYERNALCCRRVCANGSKYPGVKRPPTPFSPFHLVPGSRTLCLALAANRSWLGRAFALSITMKRYRVPFSGGSVDISVTRFNPQKRTRRDFCSIPRESGFRRRCLCDEASHCRDVTVQCRGASELQPEPDSVWNCLHRLTV